MLLIASQSTALGMEKNTVQAIETKESQDLA